VWAERVASIDEPSVARRMSAEPGFAWLDSNRSESLEGRYSFLAAWPSEEIRVEFGAPLGRPKRSESSSEPRLRFPRFVVSTDAPAR